MNEVTNLLALMPGFIVYSQLKSKLIRFGYRHELFEKTLVSLLFNIPVYFIGILILNTFACFGFDFSLIDLSNILSITKLSTLNFFILILTIAFSSYLVMIIVIKIIEYMRKINSKKDSFEDRFSTIWYDNFYKDEYSIPIRLISLNTGKEIESGFLLERRSHIDDDNFEMLLIEQDTFKESLENGLLIKSGSYISYKHNVIIEKYSELDEELPV